ncbi:uncharacterized protein LOC120691792 [Panicum virgatum]|uniref:Uncharacterized protein n=1 Tax=Panicum virgatum TaxID=38727 RepID=A0A8T0WJF6_PANVG|nr:uncharacterized protein LOC120691792 [Panicum virgatum]KAG2646187.1 hypothetical protein PVAP13_2KG491000 [Panicum virgatum]
MVRGPAMAPAAGPGEVAAAAAAAAAAAEEMRWRQLDSGVSAVSFGFVATAILVSMFLAMAILEHLLRPPAHAAAPPPRGILRRLLGRGGGGGAAPGADLEAARKLEGHAPLEIPVYPKGVSVLMPGQDMPTFIAHPAPAPCPPERIQWPSHQPPPFAGSSSNPS